MLSERIVFLMGLAHGSLEMVDVVHEFSVGGLPFGGFIYLESEQVVESL